ncbi:MAG: AAA family ATPase [Bacilli bacterium]|jgi:predicted HTH transcriptional regulator|nr:AAA family ATPase [Bacilli bacterium]
MLVKVPPASSMVSYRRGDYSSTFYTRKSGASLPPSADDLLRMAKRKSETDGEITQNIYKADEFSQYLLLCRRNRKDRIAPDVGSLISNELITEDKRIKYGFSLFSNLSNDEDSLVCCRLWRGLNKGADEAIDKKEFKGPLGEGYAFASAFVARNTKSGFIKQKNGSRLDTFSYPPIAIREALINAIAHRDYTIGGTQVDVDIFSNRIEIASPGSWLLKMDPKKYSLDKVPSIRRNPIICNAFSLAGLMEKSGSGLKKIAASYSSFDADLQPALEAFPTFFVITLYDLLYDEKQDVSLVPSENKQESIVINLCLIAPRTRGELQKACGYKSRSMFYVHVLKPLLKSGKIVMTEPTKSKNQRYSAIK